MSLRTQVYLTDEQRRRIDELRSASGMSMAEVIRTALDRYLENAATDPAAVLVKTFGADPAMDVPDRDEWDRG